MWACDGVFFCVVRAGGLPSWCGAAFVPRPPREQPRRRRRARTAGPDDTWRVRGAVFALVRAPGEQMRFHLRAACYKRCTY